MRDILANGHIAIILLIVTIRSNVMQRDRVEVLEGVVVTFPSITSRTGHRVGGRAIRVDRHDGRNRLVLFLVRDEIHRRRVLHGSEVDSVSSSTGYRHKGRRLVTQQSPLCVLEEGVVLDIRSTGLGAHSLVFVLDEELSNEVLARGRNGLVARATGEVDLLFQHIGERQVSVLALERGHAKQHLVDENTQRPPVDRRSVAVPSNHLRSNVLLRADKRVGSEVGNARFGVQLGHVSRALDSGSSKLLRLLGQVEIRQHDVAGLMQQNVFRLEISVNVAHEMQVLERSSDLGSVELRVCLSHTLALSGLQSPEKLASHAVLHTEIEVVVGLEGVVESHNEGVVGRGENLLLCKRPLDLVSLDHLLLGQHLHGKQLGGFLFLDQVDLADISSSKQPDLLKGRGTHFHVTDLYRVGGVGSCKRLGVGSGPALRGGRSRSRRQRGPRHFRWSRLFLPHQILQPHVLLACGNDGQMCLLLVVV